MRYGNGICSTETARAPFRIESVDSALGLSAFARTVPGASGSPDRPEIWERRDIERSSAM